MWMLGIGLFLKTPRHSDKVIETPLPDFFRKKKQKNPDNSFEAVLKFLGPS